MSENEHIITATEPAWVTCKYRAEDGAPVYVGNSTEIVNGVDHMQQESEYECSCGEPLNDWHDVQDHLREVSD